MTERADGLRDERFRPESGETEVVYAGRVWDVRRDRFAYGDAELVREYVDHPGAAAVVALDRDDRVLIVQQYRHPIRRRDWELPAGLLDVAGEAPLQTAQRELAEEADLVAAEWTPLLSVFTTPGGSDEVVYIFLARELRAADQAHAREAEEADMRREWMPLHEAVAGIMTGRFSNGILVAGVLAAAEKLRRA